MIFVISDDNMLNVYKSENELQGACEGIDVEEGVYQFFGSAGESLEAQFVEENQKGKLFGFLGWVVSGRYTLAPSSAENKLNLLKVLEAVAGMEENPHFKNLAEVREFLTSASSKGPSDRDAQNSRAP